jgi:hypothetical protein
MLKKTPSSTFVDKRQVTLGQIDLIDTFDEENIEIFVKKQDIL